MAPPLLVSIGYCTGTTGKLLAVFADEQNEKAYLDYRLAGETRRHVIETTLKQATPFQIANFEVQDIPASAEGTWIEYAAASGRLPEISGWNRFKLLPSERPPRIALISCNNAVEAPKRASRYKLWQTLKQQIASGNIDLIIHAGDQIYADGIRLRYRIRRRMFDPSNQDQVEEIAIRYRKLYMDTWTIPEVSSVLSTCPSILMWDDHDIFDGYGSHEDDSSDVVQTLFGAARKSFFEFQAAHNPAPLEASSFAFGFETPGCGFLVLDGRTNRAWNRSLVLGNQQQQAIAGWLQNAIRRNLNYLFVVTAIPIVYVPVAAYLKLVQMVHWHGPLSEDLRDSWLAPNNQNECRQLLQSLFEFGRQSAQTRIYILSGDAHVAALGRIHSPKYPQVTLRQVVASGIGSLPPSGISKLVLKMITDENLILTAPEFHGTLLPFPGRTDYMLAQRNFAVLQPEDGALQITFFAEDSDTVTQIPWSFG